MLRELLVASTLCVMASPVWAQALEVKAGSPLRIEQLTVRADVDEGVALVDVDQVFRNDTDSVREGVYRFRLPEKAVVHSFSMWIDGREKHGRVLEAQAARQVYDSIVRRRKDPALLEEIGWRQFQVSVFPIPARDTVRIRLVYAHVVDDDLGLRTLEIPMPEGTPVGVADVSVRVHDRQGVAVLDCPTHAGADVLHDDAMGAVRWSQEAYTPASPFRVRSAPSVDGLGLACLAFRPEESAEGTFLVRVVPRLDDVPELPRDVVFVVDRSGSMRGQKLEQAQAALRYGLSTLRPEDRFAVVAFSSATQELEPGVLLRATPESRARGRDFGDALTASGGTNIDAALRAAVALRRDDPGRLFVVSFLTDGDPTVGEKDPDRIVARYRQASDGGVRLFAFGVGDDVKDFLLTRLAKDSRGAAEYVRENEDLEVKLSGLFEKVRNPVLTDVTVRVAGDGVHVVGMEPEVMPDVFRGTAVVAAGRYTGSGPVTLRLTGRVGTTPVEASLDVTLPSSAGDQPHVAQLWARMRIDRLLDELRVHGMVPEIRQEIVALGLRYQVVTPYTSFLVVEDGIHIPDDGELARVPEGPGRADASGGQRTGTAVHAFGRKKDAGSVVSASGPVPPDSREPTDPPPPPEGGGPSTPGGETGGPVASGPSSSESSGGHGGSYRGPASGVPADSREPSDPPGDSVDRGGGASSGGGDVGGPTTGGGELRGPRTGGAGRPSATRERRDYTWWRFWWNVHGTALLGDDDRLAPELPAEIRDQVLVPALRAAALDDAESFFVRAEAQRALALWGDDAEHVRALALRMLADAPADGEAPFHRVCVESAPRLLLAPGVDGAARARLLAVLRDPTRVRSDVRAQAALVLALGGPDVGGDVVRALAETAREPGPRWAGLRAASVFAMGLLGDARAVPELVQILDDPEADDAVRAYAIDALGRLGATEQRLGFLGRLDDRRTGVVERRALPAALARIAPAVPSAEQERIREALCDAAREDDDRTVRDLAQIALARIATDGRVGEGVRGRAGKEVLFLWQNGRPRDLRAYGALALGLLARSGDAKALAELGTAAADPSPDLRAATVAARAIAGDTDGVAGLVDVARDRGEDRDLRRSVLEALAHCRPMSAVLPLRASVERSDVPDLRTATLVTLALCGDAQAVGDLVALARDDTEDERVYATLARVGDEAVARALSEIVRDEGRRHGDLTRGLAARALGRMAGAPDPRRRIAEDFPYRTWCPAIWTLMDWR